MGLIEPIVSIFMGNKFLLKPNTFGKTREQKQVIKYFFSDGCLSRMSTISDTDYENRVITRKKAFDTRASAINTISIDESQVREIPPIMIEGYVFNDNTYVKVGADNRVRTSKYQIVWLFFSQQQIYLYQYIFDMASDNTTVRSSEYFYQDITNFEVEIDTNERIVPKGCLGKRPEKTHFANSSFTLVVPGDQLKCNIDVKDIVRIKAAREMLRDKKLVK